MKKKHQRHWAGILGTLAVSLGVVNLQLDADLLKGSVLNLPEHEAFDGTVAPIDEVPNWSGLNASRYKLAYSDYESSEMIPFPEYDNDVLTFPSADLQWGNKEHNAIRNAKITFSVPYAGNYELDDCGEGCGSHPGVDIKAPEGTPVRVIANGTVLDAGTSSTWGDYVVVQHKDVPNPASPSQNTTLYSVYAHLSELFVATNDVLDKGEIIGKVGDTGTATTYHLHFQIDSADAPWHAYWPFTTADAKAAGYNFWEAVSAGVGRDNVYAYTVNPMEFVQDHLDGANVDTSSKSKNTDKTQQSEQKSSVKNTSEVKNTANTQDTKNSSTNQDASTQETSSVSSAPVVDTTAPNFDHFEVISNYFVEPEENTSVYVRLLDVHGELYERGSFKGDLTLSVSDEDVAELNKSAVDSEDFSNGRVKLDLYAKRAGEVTVTAELKGFYKSSFTIYVVDHIEPFAQFGLSTDGSFVPNKAESIRVQALDLAGKPTPSFSGDGSVTLSVVKGDASITPSTLDRSDFPTGIAEVTMTASSDEPIVLQVSYGKKSWESSTLEPSLFSDYSTQDDYFTAVSYLFKKGTVKGYPDGSFQPLRTVSRVEALKFIFAGMDQDLRAGVSANFKDTNAKEWYAPYLATAYHRGVVQGYPDGNFKPTQGVNRVEFLKMLFTTVEVSVDPVVTAKPYSDVDTLAWYAPYVQYAKEKNLFPLTGKEFQPSEPMSRSEVAEVIYRFLAVQENEGTSYSVLLKPSL